MCTKVIIFVVVLNVFIKQYVICGRKYERKLKEVFEWSQISYDFDGIVYNQNSNYKKRAGGIHFDDDLDDFEKFFIQYNNIPIGFEVYHDEVYITVPRRRYGIPSTLNYVKISSNRSPALKPFPDSLELVSVYRPRVDACDRLWLVDTGLLEVPGNRSRLKSPSIVIFDVRSKKRILKFDLNDADLQNERSPAGLTSITVDVDKNDCDNAFAYINNLVAEGMIVFSLKQMRNWNIYHDFFRHDESAMNFTVSGYTINWKDGLFSIALAENTDKSKTAYFHPLVSTEEFSISTDQLKRANVQPKNMLFKDEGYKGNNSQSGSHDYHPGTNVMFFANVAQDAILCWRVDDKMAPENVGIAAQDHKKLVYISDLKVEGDEVWVLANQIPRFVYSTLDTKEINFYVHRAKVQDLIRGTPCDRR